MAEERIMKVSLLTTLGVAVACSAGTAWAAPLVNLNASQYVLYGDAQTFSLPVAIIDQCGGTAAGCQYSVASTPGAIKDLVVLATGTSNSVAVNNFAGMDNAYATPNGASGSTFFRPNAATNQGSQGSINNNGSNTWDASLAALKTFLSGNQLVTFFNNNQTNSGGASTESLAAWAQYSITDASGTVIGVYDLTNQNNPYNLFTQGGGGVFMGDAAAYTSAGVGNPVVGTNSATDYVLSGGAICRLAGLPVPCSGAHDEGPIAHNLGADHAAYAILFPEFNAQLSTLFDTVSDADLALYTFHADIRLGCDPGINDVAGICTGNGTTLPYGRSLNNGYEQVFIGTAASLTCAPTDPACNPSVPEPGTLALISVALCALGWSTRRRLERHGCY
jgi:hypothetical protein